MSVKNWNFLREKIRFLEEKKEFILDVVKYCESLVLI